MGTQVFKSHALRDVYANTVPMSETLFHEKSRKIFILGVNAVPGSCSAPFIELLTGFRTAAPGAGKQGVTEPLPDALIASVCNTR